MLSDDRSAEAAIEQLIHEDSLTNLAKRITKATSQLPDYFNKTFVHDQIYNLFQQLSSEAECLDAWKILFQQLQFSILFVHTLLDNPIPELYKDAKQFNKNRTIANKIITLRGEIQYSNESNSNALNFINTNLAFYQQLVVTRLININKLANEIVSIAEIKSKKNSGNMNYEKLCKFISKLNASLVAVKHALESLKIMTVYVDMSTLPPDLSNSTLAFSLFDEAIIKHNLPHFLKIDMYEAKKNKLQLNNNVIPELTAACLMQELLITELFTYQAFRIMLANKVSYDTSLTLPIPNELLRTTLRLSRSLETAEDIREIAETAVTDNTNTHELIIHTYFDYTLFYVAYIDILKLTPEHASQEAFNILYGIQYIASCIFYIINCLRKQSPVYQHAFLDNQFQAEMTPSHITPIQKTKKPADEQKTLSTPTEPKMATPAAPTPASQIEESKSDILQQFKTLHDNYNKRELSFDEKKKEYDSLYSRTSNKNTLKEKPNQKKRVGTLHERMKLISVQLRGINLNVVSLARQPINDNSITQLTKQINEINKLHSQVDNFITQMTAILNSLNCPFKLTSPKNKTYDTSEAKRRNSETRQSNQRKTKNTPLSPQSTNARVESYQENNVSPIDDNTSMTQTQAEEEKKEVVIQQTPSVDTAETNSQPDMSLLDELFSKKASVQNGKTTEDLEALIKFRNSISQDAVVALNGVGLFAPRVGRQVKAIGENYVPDWRRVQPD